ncbi:XBAT33 [Symbiodinium natans]|uniref:XBAT33 protein n=1 Tax=Symbiodinium natans TaxID=878477 RepID=A0A812QJK7_9DINO|nr:XBAT33 [Symbiodinium natans]
MGQFQLQNVMNSTWAFAKLSCADAELMARFTSELPRRDLSAGDLTVAAWCCASAEHCNEQFLQKLAKDILRKLSSMGYQDLANVSWAFAKLGIQNDELFEALAEEVTRQLPQFEPQNLAITAWAFATLARVEERMLQAIAEESQRKIARFDPQCCANLLYAFGKLAVQDEKMLELVVDRVELTADRFRMLELCNSAWGISKMTLPLEKIDKGMQCARRCMGDAYGLDDLLDAARDGQLSEVKEILAKQSASQTSLRAALRHSDIERWTPLHFAAGNDHAEVVGVLLRHRADALAKTYKGDTPLHCACRHDAAKAVLQLLDKSSHSTAELLRATNRRNETALHVAAVAASPQLWASLGEAAKDCPEPVCLEERSDGGGTALHYAALEGNAVAFQTLLEARADAFAVDLEGRTPRDLVVTTQLENLLGREASYGLTQEDRVEKLVALGRGLLAQSKFDRAIKAFHHTLQAAEVAPGKGEPREAQLDWGREEMCRQLEQQLKAGETMQAELGLGGLGQSIDLCSLRKTLPQRLPEQEGRIYEGLSDPPASLRSLVADALLGLCYAHLGCGERQHCIAAAGAALRLSPASWQAFFARGTVYLQGGDLPEAEQDLKEAWRLRDKMPKSDEEVLRARIGTLRQLQSEEATAARRMLGLGVMDLDTMD